MTKSDWKKWKLDEFVDFNPKIQLKKGTNTKKVDMDKLTPFTRKITGYIETDFTSGSKFTNGDTLLARITPCLENGKTAYVDVLEDKEIGFGSTEFIVLRAIEGISVPLFVYYLATSPDFRETAIASMTGTSGRQRVDVKALEQLDINLPPVEEQKRIAQILGALDDKIELLQKQNKTLEDMAKAIFKSWFVDFDVVHAKQKGLPKADIIREYHLTDELYDFFPSSFEPSALGPIPSGWQVKKIGKLVSVVRGGSPRPIQKFLSKEGLPWLKISDATASPTKFITHIEQCIIPEGLSKTRFIKKGSLVVSNSATPGMPKFLALDTCIHDGWLFLDDYKGITKELLYYFILFNRAELVALGSGSVFTNLKTDVLKNFQIVVPTEIIQNKLNPIFAQIDEAILLHNKQIQTLTELRDTLLPPLISGKIRV